MNALGELPARQTALAAQSLEVAADIRGGELLDLAAVLRLNEFLDAQNVPTPLPLGYGSFRETTQVVIKKARGGTGMFEREWFISTFLGISRNILSGYINSRLTLAGIRQSHNRPRPYYYQYCGFRLINCWGLKGYIND